MQITNSLFLQINRELNQRLRRGWRLNAFLFIGQPKRFMCQTHGSDYSLTDLSASRAFYSDSPYRTIAHGQCQQRMIHGVMPQKVITILTFSVCDTSSRNGPNTCAVGFRKRSVQASECEFADTRQITIKVNDANSDTSGNTARSRSV